MKKLFFIFLLFGSSLIYSQDKKVDKILEEGKLLYRLEKGSWYGTDDMMLRFTTKKDSIGGYLSYKTEDEKINTIFFSRFDPDVVLIRYQFDSVPKPRPLSIDTLIHTPSDLEKSLIAIRQDARKRYLENEDDFFAFYEHTAPNFIPIIDKNKKEVFVLTGPQYSGMVLLGNDYKLKYNKKNKFKTKSKIHNTILQFPYKSEEEENEIETTYHSHILSDYISSTDICTLLLYRDFVEWNRHIVMSEKKVSIFNLEKETLFTMKSKV